MKNLFKFAVLISVILLSTNQSYSQPGRGLNRNSITAAYNPSTVKMIEGKITKLDTVTTGYGRFSGLLLTVKTKDKKMLVYVSPIWYLDEQKIKFQTGKSINITGSHVSYLNKPHVIARNIDYDKKKYEIRKDNGTPTWAGQRRGPGQGKGFRRR